MWIPALTLYLLNQKLQGEPDDLGFSKLLQSIAPNWHGLPLSDYVVASPDEQRLGAS